jgi:hypothetical protein
MIEVKDDNTLLVPIYDGIEEPHYRVEEVTRKDVLDYFARYSGDFLCSLRCLGNIRGDWRNIDTIAQACAEAFERLLGGLVTRAIEINEAN